MANGRLKTEDKALLRAIYTRHYELAAAEPPASEWRQAELDDGVTFGPLLNITGWFGCRGNEAVRMRYARALQRLVRMQLVVVDRAEGARHANVRLTPEGERLVEAKAWAG